MMIHQPGKILNDQQLRAFYLLPDLIRSLSAGSCSVWMQAIQESLSMISFLILYSLSTPSSQSLRERGWEGKLRCHGEVHCLAAAASLSDNLFQDTTLWTISKDKRTTCRLDEPKLYPEGSFPYFKICINLQTKVICIRTMCRSELLLSAACDRQLRISMACPHNHDFSEFPLLCNPHRPISIYTVRTAV